MACDQQYFFTFQTQTTKQFSSRAVLVVTYNLDAEVMVAKHNAYLIKKLFLLLPGVPWL